MTSTQRTKTSRIYRYKLLAVSFLLACSSLALITPNKVSAAQITARKVTMSSSAGAATSVTYTFNFTVPSATVLESFEAEICTTASGACSTPTGWTGAGADLASQPTNYGDASGWTDASTSSALRMVKNGNVAAPTGSQTVAFNGITNTTANNQTFFARITTYSDETYTTDVDTGVVAGSTAQQISLTGVMDESLTFCTGTSITGTNCGTVAGSSVDFGTFSSSATSSGTSVMAASTNGVSGYSITVNGSTLTCASCSGSPTISALAAQTAASVGSEQYGLNLKDNATPNVGAEVSGTGSGTATANYGTADQYRFVSADSVASAAAATNANTFTATYIVNVGGATEAGTYTATMTYIATATF